jgi:hypothetical protein
MPAGRRDPERALDELFAEADRAIRVGANINILSDRDIDSEHAAIPASWPCRASILPDPRRLRSQASIVLESGETAGGTSLRLPHWLRRSAVNPYGRVAVGIPPRGRRIHQSRQ